MESRQTTIICGEGGSIVEKRGECPEGTIGDVVPECLNASDDPESERSSPYKVKCHWKYGTDFVHKKSKHGVE